MARRPGSIPSYRLHRPTGQAVVRLDGRDHYLGRHGTPESHERYRRLVADWLAHGGGPRPAPPVGRPGLTVDELILAFLRHAERTYRHPDGRPTGEYDNFRLALRPVRRLFGSTPAAEFGPRALRAVREEVIRSGLARTTVNARVNRIRRVVRWAVGAELLPPAACQALQAVEGLRPGRGGVREAPGVRAVATADVEATLPHLPAPVAGMVRLQLLTGMRAGEVLAMRSGEVHVDGDAWEYRPQSHKNAWRGPGAGCAAGAARPRGPGAVPRGPTAGLPGLRAGAGAVGRL
jgi:hypothetical protein